MTTLGTRPRGPVGRLVARVLSDDTLAKKASLNMLASVLDYTARVVVGLLVFPVLVSRLGDLVFGVYQTLGRLVGYATPAGGRPSQALKWTIAQRQYSTDFDDKRREVGSAVAVWLLFLPVLLLAGGVLAWFAPAILGVPDSIETTVRLAAAVLVLELVAGNLATIPEAVVQGENLGYKRMGLSTLVVFVGGGLAVAAALLGGGLVGVTAAVLATTLLTGALFWWVARANVTWFGLARPAFGRARSFLRLSTWFLLWNLVMQLLRASDVVVLGIVGSGELVTVYTLSRYVPEAAFGVVAIVVSAVMPGLGGLVGARQFGRVADVRSESMAVTWLIATSAGAAFLVAQEPFLRLWVGDSYYPGRTASLLIVLLVLQFALIRNDAAIIDITLELRSKVVLGFVSAAVSIGAAVGLMTAWERGITAMAVGFLAGRALMTVAYPLLVGASLGITPRSQLTAVVRPGLVSAGAFAAALLLAPSLRVGSWPALVALAAAALAGFAVASLYAGLPARRRRRILARVRQVAGRD